MDFWDLFLNLLSHTTSDGANDACANTNDIPGMIKMIVWTYKPGSGSIFKQDLDLQKKIAGSAEVDETDVGPLLDIPLLGTGTYRSYTCLSAYTVNGMA